MRFFKELTAGPNYRITHLPDADLVIDEKGDIIKDRRYPVSYGVTTQETNAANELIDLLIPRDLVSWTLQRGNIKLTVEFKP